MYQARGIIKAVNEAIEPHINNTPTVVLVESQTTNNDMNNNDQSNVNQNKPDINAGTMASLPSEAHEKIAEIITEHWQAVCDRLMMLLKRKAVENSQAIGEIKAMRDNNSTTQAEGAKAFMTCITLKKVNITIFKNSLIAINNTELISKVVAAIDADSNAPTAKPPVQIQEQTSISSSTASSSQQSLQSVGELNSWVLSSKQLEKGDLLGKGSFGEVYKAIYTVGSVEVMAVIKKFTRTWDDKALREFKQEAAIMKGLKHDNIVRIYGICLEVGMRGIVMEYVPSGNLQQLIHNQTRELPLKQCDQLAIGILSALEYLHSKGIIHRDLKPANIFVVYEVDSQGQVKWLVKVGDFGLSKLTSADNTQTVSLKGSPAYMAPESVQTQYSSKSDIYSFAIIVWELLTRKVPYGDIDVAPLTLLMQVCNQDLRPIIPEDCPKSVQETIVQNLDKDPGQRSTAAQLLLGIQAHGLFAQSPQLIKNIGSQDTSAPDNSRGDSMGGFGNSMTNNF